MIRRAAPGDIEALAEVHVRSWQAAYRGLIPDAFLDGLRVEERAARWLQIFGQEDRDIAVCEHGGRVVGFVNVGRSRDADAAPDTGELMALYLDPAVWRHGLGRQLIAWALDTARERRWARMTLWVLRDNLAARRFYEVAGFHADGTTHERSFGAPVVEVRYVIDCAG